MCQLTFIRGKPLLVRSMLFNLSAINSRSGNTDGFGYYNFNNKIIFKTKESAKDFVYTDEFLDKLDKDFPINSTKKISVLSHVRSASRWGGKMQEINDKNSHPFMLRNLVLAHNGTLFPKDEKDELKDSIDTYWFLSKLDSIVKENKLTHKHIIDAMKYFEGKFAFLIVDMLQPNDLWIVRGESADLNCVTYVDEDDKEVLFLINTQKTSIENTISHHFYRILLGRNIKFKGPIKEFTKERIYRYNVISGKLTKFKDEIKEETRVIKSTWTSTRNARGITHQYSSYKSNKEVVKNIMELATKNMLTYGELSTLYNIYIGNSFFKPEREDLLIFIDMLEELHKEVSYKGRLKAWIDITEVLIEKGFDVMDIYNAYPNLAFPWMLNSKKTLKFFHKQIIKTTNKMLCSEDSIT